MKEPFTQIPNRLLISDQLDCYEKIIFCLIAMCGKKSFPSYRILRKWSGISADKVWKCLRTLEEKNLIQRFSQGQRVYYLTHWNPSDEKFLNMKPIRYTDRRSSKPIRQTDKTYPPDGYEPIRQTEPIKTKEKDLIKRVLANALFQKEIPKN